MTDETKVNLSVKHGAASVVALARVTANGLDECRGTQKYIRLFRFSHKAKLITLNHSAETEQVNPLISVQLSYAPLDGDAIQIPKASQGPRQQAAPTCICHLFLNR